MDAIAVVCDALAVLLAGWACGLPGASRRWRAIPALTSVGCAVVSPVLVASAGAPEWSRIAAVSSMFLAFCAVASVVSAMGSAPDDDGSGGFTCGDWDPNSPDTPGGGTDDFEP